MNLANAKGRFLRPVWGKVGFVYESYWENCLAVGGGWTQSYNYWYLTLISQ